MKYFLLIITVFILKTGSAQEVIKVNFQDSCIISSCTINKDEFISSIRRICPAGVDKVVSFLCGYKAGEDYKEYSVSGNWLSVAKFYPKMPSGTKIYCTEIKGAAADKGVIKVPDITITVK